MRFLLLFAASLSLAACSDDDTLTCTAKACGGGTLSIALVDDAGNAVEARGQFRVGDGLAPAFFDCTGSTQQTGSDPAFCKDSVIALDRWLSPDSIVELRYELAPDTYTEWERLQLQYTSHTERDFNGPGCDCTWYDAADRSTVVPEAARRPMP